ncbi:ThiF family adenylyltransferase [Mangrovimonas sp. DI 80]|uniref:ThiF family adenylyltransferase n=1 Tax=Mangrovimonas sp. DI 80 TaxID=1779330 RepID=UPI0015C553BF|nr:ThiF family adenylyltransferase [Mangrovimonas sp. DI 80]
MNKEEWYHKRNDRSNRIEGVLLGPSAKRIGIKIGNESKYSVQVLSLVLLNIMSRWCRRITVELIDVDCVLKSRGGIRLKELLTETMKGADPYGDFLFDKVEHESCDIIIDVGGGDFDGHDKFWVDSNEWIAGIGYGVKSNSITKDSTQLHGAAYAAAMINSIVFEVYLGLAKKESFQYWMTLFDFDSSRNPSDLKNPVILNSMNFGNIWQVGAGAVGSNFDYLLSVAECSCNVHIIDYDCVEVSNTSSSLVFNAEDVLGNQKLKKVDLCERVLENHEGIRGIAFDGDYNDFIKFRESKETEIEYPDVLLCFANERNIWSTIQNNEPPITLAATTSNNWTVNFFRHMPFIERCIACSFKSKKIEGKLICSSGLNIDEGVEEKLGSLPFLSFAAAVLIYVELIKLSHFRDSLGGNFGQFPFRNLIKSNIIPMQLDKGDGCNICRDQTRENYTDEYSLSKYYVK